MFTRKLVVFGVRLGLGLSLLVGTAACGDKEENAAPENADSIGPNGTGGVNDTVGGTGGTAGTESTAGTDNTAGTENTGGTEGTAGTENTDSEDPNLPEDFNTPCEHNEQCTTGFCIDGPDGKVCTKTCIDDCPEHWACEGVTNFGSDVTYICVPKFVALCTACEKDSDCGGSNARCVEIEGEGGRCERECSLEEPCPGGYLCKPLDDAFNLCHPSTGSCICTEGMLGQEEVCYAENSVGICKGKKTCAGAGGWTECDAKIPVPEYCDGWDNDCDGEIDESLEEPCTNANEFGACVGVKTCQGAAGFVCNAAVPAAEACDEIDNDCDGSVNEEDAIGCTLYYEDIDKDGLGNGQSSACLCKKTGNFTASAPGDCHDLNPNIGFGKTEVCNGQDDDCDGVVDPENTQGCTFYFKDADGDGFGTSGDSQCLCAPAGVYKAAVGGDCDDTKVTVFIGNVEVCNGVDDNCNGVVDEPGAIGCLPFLLDSDGDGYGVTGLSQCMCAATGDWKATAAGDCDDSNPEYNPIAIEICDGADNNCNGIPDDDCDKDSDGYCNALKPVDGLPPSCPLGGGDCVDFDPGINPGAKETCDEVDNNCNGVVDEGVQAPCGGCSEVCLMGAGPKSEEEFQDTEDGALFDGAGKDEDGNIVLDTSTIALNMIWISNSGQGTVSKLNTTTGDEVSRYNLCKDPSRTAVDSLGNAWVACRGDARVVKVALSEDECIDKNGDGIIQTSKDANGNKVIDGDEMLAADTDECVLFAVQPDGAGALARAMGVDKENNGWAGMWNTKRLWRVSGEDGSVLQKIDIPTNPYGLALDQDGIIWIAGRGTSQLVRVDPTNNNVQSFASNLGCFQPYGMTIDENGRIWTANCCCEHVAYRYDPPTNTWAKAAVNARPRGIAANGNGFVFVANDESDKVHKIDINSMAVTGSVNLGGGRFPVGMAVDFDGKVWAINQKSSSATRIDGETMGILFEKPTGKSPYTYSDMTGFQQKTIVAPKGTYRHTFQGWTAGATKWMQIGLQMTTPAGTSARMRVRAAAKVDELEFAVWSPYWGPFPPELPTVNLNAFGNVIGQYLEVEVELFSEDSKTTPILKSIDVVATAL